MKTGQTFNRPEQTQTHWVESSCLNLRKGENKDSFNRKYWLKVDTNTPNKIIEKHQLNTWYCIYRVTSTKVSDASVRALAISVTFVTFIADSSSIAGSLISTWNSWPDLLRRRPTMATNYFVGKIYSIPVESLIPLILASATSELTTWTFAEILC